MNLPIEGGAIGKIEDCSSAWTGPRTTTTWSGLTPGATSCWNDLPGHGRRMGLLRDRLSFWRGGPGGGGGRPSETCNGPAVERLLELGCQVFP